MDFGKRDRDLDAELAAHLAMSIEDRVARGESREEAERAARREFGNRLLVLETTRDTWKWRPLEDLAGDFTNAWRQIARRPGFALACAGVLAVGLAATTLVSSVLYRVILKPPPYKDPGQLVVVHNRFEGLHLTRLGASELDVLNLSARRDLFASVGTFYFLDLSRTGVDHPVKVNAVSVSRSMFPTLGIEPILGRGFTEQDDHPVVISESYWRSEFAGDPGILHRTMRLDDEIYSIVGVMPASFVFPNEATQMWVASKSTKPASAPPEKRAFFLRTWARLAPGVTLQQASARMQDVSRQFFVSDPVAYPMERLAWQFFIVPLNRDDDGSLRRSLWTLVAAVGCLLLIVCSNVSGLLLARSTERQHDLSIRLALGAGRLRVMRLVLVEIVALAITGGLAGIALGAAAIAMIERIPGVGSVHLEMPAAWITLAVALAAGIASGAYPAWAVSRMPASEALKAGGHQRTAAGFARRRQQALITAQVALATTLLIAGGLLLRSMGRLIETSAGFDPHDLLTLQIDSLPKRHPKPEDKVRFFAQVLNNIAAIPGVEAVSGGRLPFGWGDQVGLFHIEGQPKLPADPSADLSNILPNYFQTMRIPMLEGRAFSDRDTLATQPVAIIDETLARRFFGLTNPVGQRVRMDWGVFTVVGVAGSVKSASLDEEPQPTIYFSALQKPGGSMEVVVKSRLPQTALVPAIERAVTAVDKDQPIHEVATMDAVMKRSFGARQTMVWLLGAFAISGVVLAAVGLYAMLAYVVGQRRRELSIRKALGATSGSIARLVTWSGAVPILGGLMMGCVGAVAAERWVASQLYATRFRDPLTWSVVISIVILSGGLAVAIPAWRAARANPAEALRAD